MMYSDIENCKDYIRENRRYFKGNYIETLRYFIANVLMKAHYSNENELITDLENWATNCSYFNK